MKKKNIVVLASLCILIVILIISLNLGYWNSETCNSECIHRGHEAGICMWASEMNKGDIRIGSCLVIDSKHCGNEWKCNCYCEEEEEIECPAEAKICPDGTGVRRVAPDCEFENCLVSEICEIDSDCVIFGEDGDCNCGCYNKDALPTSTGGACFCAAPISCECVDNICERIFE
jgi:hypothetical protein